MLIKTLDSLVKTVDLKKHRLFIIDNASTDPKVQEILIKYSAIFGIINNPENIGTARAINQAWSLREPEEHCIKMDDDVIIHQKGWVDELEHALECDSKIGILGLKRKDCWENPNHPNPDFKSKLEIINRPNEKWVIVEKVNHIIGTCQIFNTLLLDKIGYLYQIGLYGYDDVLAGHRSHIAGFDNAFLPHIEIDHIDDGGTPFQKWKEGYVKEDGTGKETRQLIRDYHSGKKNIYQDLY